jgi:hypothetical protein
MHLTNSPSDFLINLKELVYVRTGIPLIDEETDLNPEKDSNQESQVIAKDI